MQALALPGLHGVALQLDHCRACRLVWFDALEPSALAQSAWVALLQEMARSGDATAASLDTAPARWPRCQSALEATQQVSAFGRSASLACPRGHGQAARDGTLLASRGLFRPLQLAERVLLAADRRRLFCLPCGAPLTGAAERCGHCDSPATVFDLPRLSQALGLLDAAGSVGADLPLQPWPCRGCGAPLDVTRQPSCPQCQRPVLAPALADLAPLLEGAQARLARRSAEAAQQALARRSPEEQHRVHALTGREEHRQALGLLEARFWRRWRWVVALFGALWLMAWCTNATAQAQPRRHVGDHAGPAALDSPAWRDLMAEPLHRDDTMSYHAAAVAARWGRQAEAAALQRHLLLRHGQALVSGPPDGTLGALLALPPPEPAAVQAAWDAGLDQAWSDVAWEAAPPVLGLPEGATPWPSRPGFWRLRGGGLAAQALVHNRARFVVTLPGPLQLGLRSGETTLSLACTLVASTGRWLPGESARFWCLSPGAVPEAAWASLTSATPLWRSNLPVGDAAMSDWIDRLAGRQPLAVGVLADRHAHCRDQKNCRQGAVPTTEDLARWRAENEAREPAARARMERERARAGGAQGLYMWGSVVAGFAIYALVARAAGTALATGLTIGLSVIAAVWLFGAARSSDGWGALGLLIIAFGAPVYGVVLSLIYRWLYRRFLAPG
jgi:hypothetical protein